MERISRDYNFFESYQQKASSGIQIKSAGFLTILMLLAIAGASIGLMAQTRVLQSDVSEAKAELSAIQTSAEYITANELQQAIDLMTKYDENAAVALKRIEKGNLLGTKFLTTLSDAMPETAKIQEATVTRTFTNVKFYVPSRTAAAELLDSLDQSGLFVHTSLAEIAKTGEIGYIADINMVMKAGEE